MSKPTVNRVISSSAVARPPARADAPQLPAQDQGRASQGRPSSGTLADVESLVPRRIRVPSLTESTSDDTSIPQYITHPAPPHAPLASSARLPQSTAANTSGRRSTPSLLLEVAPADQGGSFHDDQEIDGFILRQPQPSPAKLVDLNCVEKPCNTTSCSSPDSAVISANSTAKGTNEDDNDNNKHKCKDDRKGKGKCKDEDDNNANGRGKVKVKAKTRSVSPRPDTPRPDTPRPDTPRPDTPRPDTPRPDTPRPDLPDEGPIAPEDFIRLWMRPSIPDSLRQPDLKGKDTEEAVKQFLPSSQRPASASGTQQDLPRRPRPTIRRRRHSPEEPPARASSSTEPPICDGNTDGFYYGTAYAPNEMQLRYSNEDERNLTNFERITQYNLAVVAGEVAYISSSVHNIENTIRRWEDATNARNNGIFPPPYQQQLPPSAIPHNILPPPPAGMPVEQQRMRRSEEPTGPPGSQQSSRRPSYQTMTPSPRLSEVGASNQQTTEATTTTDNSARGRNPQMTTATNDDIGSQGPQTNEEPGPWPAPWAANVFLGLVGITWIVGVWRSLPSR